MPTQENPEFRFADEEPGRSDSDVLLGADTDDEGLQGQVSELGLAEPDAGQSIIGQAIPVKSTSSKALQKKPKPQEKAPVVDPKLVKLFDESGQISSTARQYVEIAYQKVDPNDPDSRKQARDALRESLTLFAQKALSNGALNPEQVAQLFHSANTFAGTLLLVRKERQA